MRITITATQITGGIYAYIANNQGQADIIVGSLFDDSPSGVWEFDVPVNGVSLMMYSHNEYEFNMTSIQYLAGGATQEILKVPYLDLNNDKKHILQNGYMAFAFLQRYYMFDMPAWNVEINGVRKGVSGIKKLKTQTIKFPALNDPNLQQLVKTNLGNGRITKLSVNLSSRNANATLKYDTE